MRLPPRSVLVAHAKAHPLAALAAIALAGAATAAVLVTYATPSTLVTTVTPPPIQLAAGDDTGALGDHVSAFALSTNRTYVTATVRGVPEASLVVGSFLKLQNVDDAPHAVTLTTANVTNSLVTAYTLQIHDEANALAGTLDLRAASSTVSTTVTIPAGATYSMRLTLSLAAGAGAHNVDLTNGITLSFT